MPKRYEHFYRISDYDGNESVEILYDKYKISTIGAILKNSNLNSDDKIAQITTVFSWKELKIKKSKKNNFG